MATRSTEPKLTPAERAAARRKKAADLAVREEQEAQEFETLHRRPMWFELCALAFRVHALKKAMPDVLDGTYFFFNVEADPLKGTFWSRQAADEPFQMETLPRDLFDKLKCELEASVQMCQDHLDALERERKRELERKALAKAALEKLTDAEKAALFPNGRPELV